LRHCSYSIVIAARGGRVMWGCDADIDNNVPEGSAVPLVLTSNFMKDGVQKQLTSTALVKVVK